MSRVALYLQDAHPIRDAMRYVQHAEAAGFDAVWQAESRLVREATVPLAAFGAVTERIKLGSGVVSMWVRNPAFLTATFSTLDDLAPGRVVLGIGAWWDPLAAKVGVDRSRPLRAMREIVTAVRALLANETVTFAGDFVHLDGVELDYVHQERRPKHIPIVIGATGMQMMQLAGEIADGALLNYLVSPDYNVRAMAALGEGAARAGRPVDAVDRPQLVVCSMDDDRAKALDAARLLVTQYLGQQPHIMQASGVAPELLEEIGKVLTWPATHGEVVAASRLVPDDVVQLITASGTPDECRAKVAEYMASGCTCPVLYPLGPDVDAMIDAFRGVVAVSGDGLMEALQYFWHPVCTRAELAAAAPHPLGVRLLGRELAVAELGGDLLAAIDRCPHRSTRLSVGAIEGDGLRCAYHGWRYTADGACVEIPSTPNGPLPTTPCLETFEARLAYDLVWVRLDDRAGTAIPANPAWDDHTMHVVAGAPYTWPTSALRRVENFVDLAHFPFVHDGTLGRRDAPVPPIPSIERVEGELRFRYDPPAMPVEHEALFGASRYRMPMPCTVDIEFELESGARRRLWMTASPIDAAVCRSFWFVCRDDDRDGDDAAHLAFQQVILDQDEPVVCNQNPPELVLDPALELSVRTDRVSIEYRRWLFELAHAALAGPEPVATAIGSTTTITVR